MAYALLGIVIGNLQTFLQNELATFWGVDSEIQKLSSNLTAIRAVLQDAEEKQITDHAVKDWLQKLTDAAYVLDDILDSCSIESDRLQSEQGKCGFARKAHTSACLTRFHPSTILFRRDIGKRMKAIVERFHNIDEERRRFEFRAGVIERQQEEEEDHEWRQTSSAITEPHIYGRDQDKEKIVEFLSRHDSSSDNLSVYPVVGMGGLGKTTLARWVFNDDRVIKHFDLRIWFCVSSDFNLMKILQSIVESATGHNPNLSTFESLQKKVQEVLQGKKYLLVLDDVWNEDLERWEKLKSALQCGGGTKGASILVTTRLEGVASIMGTCSTHHHLLPLSEDDNWLLFKHYAFGPNREEPPELVAIGKEIVKKCVGSPLASKALGSSLLKKNEKKWLNMKESKFWDIPEGDAVMRALRISYFNLKLQLRHCFSFCAIYPEDFRISKQEVIYLWMANGLIQSRGNLEVEDVGNETWEELYRRSFFQEVNTALSGTITFKIHDLFHELAQSISGEECKASMIESLNNLPSRVHHIYCSHSVGWFNLDKDAFKKFESLRTFIVPYPRIHNFHRIEASNCLRALHTNFRQLSALKSLTHLRYLNIYNSDMTSLPKCVSSLQKLQVLKLESCRYLSCLPEQLTQLKDLRHLLIERCLSLVVMPPKIGELKCLKTLNIFIVDSKPGFGLAELHDLQLGGKLHIKGLQNVLSQSDARSANLISKKELNCLYLSWDSNSNSECGKAEGVLEALEPHRNLKSFGIKGYMGKQFPHWMMNTSVLSNLLSVMLYDCKNCERLPPLGKLPNLTNLCVSGMRDVKYIDDDSYDGMDEQAFKSLKNLYLLGLPNLERMLKDETVGMLPLLSVLRISCVPKLRLPLLPSIEHLDIQGLDSDSDCDGDEDMASFPGAVVQNMPHVKTLSIERFAKLKLIPDELGSLNSLKELVILECDEIESFSENVLQGLSSLRTLGIFRCKKLKSLSEGGMWNLHCLENLVIGGCPELVALPDNMNQLTALCRVFISFRTTLPEGLQCIPSLQILTLHAVDSLPEWFGEMTSLQQLEIKECPNIRSLPSSFQHLTNLSELCIVNCPKLEKQCKRVTGEDRQKIAHIPKLDIFSGRKVTFYEKIQRRWDRRKESPSSEFDRMVEVVDHVRGSTMFLDLNISSRRRPMNKG